MKNSIYLFTILLLFLSACKNEKKQDEKMNEQTIKMKMEKESTSQDDSMKESKMQKNDLTAQILDSYIQVKNNLIEDDKNGAADAGKNMLTAFSNFDMSSLNDKNHKEYMEIAESAKEHAEHIIKSDIGHQREHFESLTTDMSDLITLLGTNKTLYQDFCPMDLLYYTGH